MRSNETAKTRRTVMKFNQSLSLIIALCLTASMAWADSLELKNGSLINGKFMGGTESAISFQVGSEVQSYNLADITSLKFDSGTGDTPARAANLRSSEAGMVAAKEAATYVTIPAGTTIAVRTIDSIDSTKNHVGDRFEATLEEPLIVDGNVVVSKGADLYGRLAESKKSGTFTGRSELQVELTGIVVNEQTIPLGTGDYEFKGNAEGA